MTIALTIWMLASPPAAILIGNAIKVGSGSDK